MSVKRRTFIAAGAALGASSALLWAQGAKALARVSFLSNSSLKSYGHLLEEFRAGLRALGYVEGRDVSLDLWWADDRLDRIPALIGEMLASKPAVIVTHGSPNVAALQGTGTAIPIVFASAGDPVGQGFVASFRRPGSNITGIAFNDEINQKLYELVKIVIPAATRVATLMNPGNPAAKHHLSIVPATTKALGLQSMIIDTPSAQALEPAFARAAAAKVQALIAPPLAPFIGLRDQIVQLQSKYRLPTFHGTREGSAAGGLASYSFPMEESFRRAAAMVDQVLKGRSPAEIPVEIPTKYEIAINLNTARALGISVPEAALLRAQRVIES